jgi:hypothetical protein
MCYLSVWPNNNDAGGSSLYMGISKAFCRYRVASEDGFELAEEVAQSKGLWWLIFPVTFHFSFSSLDSLQVGEIEAGVISAGLADGYAAGRRSVCVFVDSFGDRKV